MAAVLVAGVLDFVLYANKNGALVVSVRRCDSWLACRRGSLAQGGTARGESFALLDTTTKNTSYSWRAIFAA